MTTLITVLLVLAAVSFAAAAINVASRINLVALGLLAWVLTLLVPRL